MAVEIAPNEGKQYVGQNAISGRTVYCFAIYGQTVAATTLSATSLLASTIQEDTNIARVSAVLGAMNAQGIIVFPGVTLTAAAGAHNNISAWGWASAASGGVAIFLWDLSATRDMSTTGAQLIIPTLNYFYKNPGE